MDRLLRPRVRRWSPGESATDSFELGKGKTVAVLAFGTEGRLLVMLDEGVHWFDKGHGLHAKPEKNATA